MTLNLERHYTHHEGRGETPHRSNPVLIRRDLAELDVRPGMRVLEIGTGSGYTGALLSKLVGESGYVTSLDVDPYLTRWANLVHHERGLRNIMCVPADGLDGYLPDAPYDRLVAWCTPPCLPQVWIDQLAPDARIVTPLPLAEVPLLTAVASIHVAAGEPRVEAAAAGGYVEAAAAPTDHTIPARWVDWEDRVPEQAWIALAWRGDDDWLHTGARHALTRLNKPAHIEYVEEDVDWYSWRTHVATHNAPHLTIAQLADGQLALGHSTHTTAAALRQDGSLIADASDSPSLEIVRAWVQAWQAAGRPPVDAYQPQLAATDKQTAEPGWDLRLRLPLPATR